MTVGKFMAFGGLGVAALGYYPAPRLAGLATFFLGVPLVGLGASQMSQAAQASTDDYHPKRKGWKWYFAGLALTAAGIEGVASIGHGGSPGEVLGGFTLVAAGLICDLVALIKFSNFAAESSQVLASLPEALVVEPIVLYPQDRATPGLQLTYRF